MKNQDLFYALDALSDACSGVLAVRKVLTPEQRAEAIRETDEWLKKHLGGENNEGTK